MASKTPRAPRIHLQITEEIIESSLQRDSSHCILAEALKAAYPDAQRISVDLQTIRFTDPKRGLRFTYLTPRVGQVCLVNWDQGTKPTPFDCRLTNGQVTRAGQRASHKALRSSPGTPAQMKQRKQALQIAQDELKKARLSSAKPSTGVVPDVIGGRTPPLAPLARRRAFGLRALNI